VWEEIFNSDKTEFGGSGVTNPQPIKTERSYMHGLPASAVISVPPLGAVVLRCKRKYPQKKK
jgi:1,4-alpha-glucan branching enzyme